MTRQGILISELAEFHFEPIPAAMVVQPHLHHFHQLDVMLEGEAILYLEGLAKKTRVGPGAAILMPPLLRHGFETRAGCHHAVFKLHVNAYYWRQFGPGPRITTLPAQVLHVVRDAGEHYKAGAPLAWEQVSSVSMLCLTHFAGAADNDDDDAAPDGMEVFRSELWRVLERIESKPQHEWTVNELARQCHMSKDHFSRCFTRALNKNPRQYLLDTRMRIAAQQLSQSPPLPIKQVAEQAGYGSVHAFTRAFTRVLGVSPAMYRRS